ncbi:MAG: type IV pilus secretin PilQ [Massilia sp.]
MKKNFITLTGLVRMGAMMLMAMAANHALAQENAIESISAQQQGNNVVVNIAMKNTPVKLPIGFSITNPTRIALDFSSTANATGRTSQDVNIADLRAINVVQAGERTRLVFNMKRSLNYAMAIDGKSIIVTVDGSGGTAQAVDKGGLPVAQTTPVPTGRQLLKNIDFRKGPNGEGRIQVDLPHNQVAVDVHQTGNAIIIDFMKTGVPDTLRRRIDTTDFGTPVALITTVPQGDHVRMTVEARGLWEQTVYQSDTQLVIDVKPIKEDPTKLTQGSQGYRGEKITFNFQNVEVRAALQAIADISGLNIITSESVAGNLTMHLKEVPWDQALNAILQAKGLDMRKDGSVLWIAPKEELLTKEKLELEQRSMIADLEPLKSEIFQLNYQKVEAFRSVFGLGGTTGGANAPGSPAQDAGAGGNSYQNRVLSKRGSAIIDSRTNQLFITDTPSKLDDIRKLIQKTDVPSRQVLVEARLVEANDGFARNLGAKLGFTDLRGIRGGDVGYQVRGNERVAIGGNMEGIGTITGQNGSTSTDGFANSTLINLPAPAINGAQAGTLAASLFSAAANRFLNLELSALEADGKGKIISSPRVVTEDKHAAVIEQGVELPYLEAASSGAGVVAYKKANLRLEVTPQITPDGNVVLEVNVNKDSKGEESRFGFAINTQHVQTKVMVENGGTVVLGGIYTQTETNNVNKVPLLGDLPIVGYLFKSTQRNSAKTELLVFITPKIIAERTSTR